MFLNAALIAVMIAAAFASGACLAWPLAYVRGHRAGATKVIELLDHANLGVELIPGGEA